MPSSSREAEMVSALGMLRRHSHQDRVRDHFFGKKDGRVDCLGTEGTLSLIWESLPFLQIKQKRIQNWACRRRDGRLISNSSHHWHSHYILSPSPGILQSCQPSWGFHSALEPARMYTWMLPQTDIRPKLTKLKFQTLPAHSHSLKALETL